MEVRRSGLHRPDRVHESGGRLVVIWCAWWAALLFVWFLLVDTLRSDELIVGSVAAAVAAAVAAVVHRRGYIRFSPRARWIRQTPAVCRGIIIDCAKLAGALWRRVVRREHVEGVTFRVPFVYGGENGRDGARRALVNFAVSITPNSYVIDIDPEADSLLVHMLVPGPLDPVLTREQERAARAMPWLNGGDA